MSPGDDTFGELDGLIAETDLELESQFQALEGATALDQASAELASAQHDRAGARETVEFTTTLGAHEDPLKHLKDRFAAKAPVQSPFLNVTCPRCRANTSVTVQSMGASATFDPRCAACAASLVIRP